MKITLLFLAVFVAVSHQQYYNYRNYRTMFGYPWFIMPFPHQLQPDAFSNDFVTGKEDVYPELENNQHIFTGEEDEEQEEFADIQSRIKGRYRPRPSFQDKQNARFLFNLFASTTGPFNNPFFKTATFTSTQTLTLVSVVSCVPPNQVIAEPVPACRRKREDEPIHEHSKSYSQFQINPSETLKLITTETNVDSSLNGNDRSLDLLLSSKDDITQSEMEMLSTDNYNSREKRFFINKNRFIVTSVLTTYAFVNQTITATVNLLNPLPAADAPVPCKPADAIVDNMGAVTNPAVICVPCLPTGFVVCPVPGR